MNMNKLSLITPAFFAAALFSSCGSSSADTQEAEVKAPAATETFSLQKDKFSTTLQLPGELIAFQQVDLYAKVTGFVRDLKVDIGSEVTAGQLLISLEAPELASQLNAAESRLKSQEAIYAASNANYNRLVETSKTPGTVSQNDLDNAAAKKNSDAANLEAAKAAYKEVGVMRDYLEIRAPFNGIITARNVNVGAYVGPSGKGSEFPLFTLQEQKQLRLAVSIPEAYTGFLKQDDNVKFKVKSFPGETFSANIKRMAGALDVRLRSERVEMDVANADKRLLPGMIAEVMLTLSGKDSTFVAPKTAVVNSNEGVYVIRIANNKMQRVMVKKGREMNDKIELFGELQQNDRLVTKATEEMRDGTAITK